MDNFLHEVKITKKVQSNINRFESLSLNEHKDRSKSEKTAQPKKAIIEIDSEKEAIPLLTAVSSKLVEPVEKTTDSRSNIPPQTSPLSHHNRKDSTVFIRQDYLKDSAAASLVDDAREILKSQPGIEEIGAVLAYIHCGIEGQHDFNIKVTGPKSSMLVHVLVATTVPDLWPSLATSQDDKMVKRMTQTLIELLFSVTGIEAILQQIRTLTKPDTNYNSELLTIYTEVLSNLLQGQDTALRLLRDMSGLYEKEVQRKLFWQGVVSLLAGSKILSATTSIPNVVVESGNTVLVPEWLVRGTDYSNWLARNIVKASIELGPQESHAWASLGQLFRRGLSLGYKEAFVSKLYKSLLLGKTALWSPLHQLIKTLPTHDQKAVFDCILADLSKSYFSNSHHLSASTKDESTTHIVAGIAALINGLISHNDYLIECAVDWISITGGPNSRNFGMRRAMIAVLARSQAELERVLERALTSFSDKIQIQNAAMTQQEHLAQTILLAVGYLNRQQPLSLKMDPVPSLVMNAVSNRLASSVPRTRLLGMIVGVGISRCVDEPDKVMDFRVEEMEASEVKELLALINVQDRVGEVTELNTLPSNLERQERASRKRKVAASQAFIAQKPEPKSRILAIEEVSTSSDDEDDLVPYQKPPDDPEDSDEDPTLINRDKPRAPIYIVDLIKQLRSPSDKLDTISLALKTAVSLIRRKANFGTELSDNIHSLASTLINLQDGMSKSEHQQQRLYALIACLIAKPEPMGKYLTNVYFEGDFSMSQRSTLLIALGLGARELAGFSDAQNAQSSLKDGDLFPSQRLPGHLQPKPLTAGSGSSQSKELSGTKNPISLLTNIATQDTIRPMALAAAESQSGPEILKITRTSSRLNASKNKSKSKQLSLPQNIFNILTNSFYLPLASPLAAILSHTSTSRGVSTNTLLLHPSILTLHLQTLSLLLHTLGPTGLSPFNTFSSITHETLALLTSLRHNIRLSLDGVVLPAMLGLFLALIDITTEIGVTAQERLLADPFGTTISELARWVSGLEESGRAPPPMKDEDGRGGEGVAWTLLAAGIQVRWWEMGRRFQGRMLGLSLDD